MFPFRDAVSSTKPAPLSAMAKPLGALAASLIMAALMSASSDYSAGCVRKCIGATRKSDRYGLTICEITKCHHQQ
jgi:hypothetical protein